MTLFWATPPIGGVAQNKVIRSWQAGSVLVGEMIG